MKRFKILSFLFCLLIGAMLVCVILFNQFINENNQNDLLKYVPEESSAILQINNKAGIKEVGYRALFYSKGTTFFDSLKIGENSRSFGIKLDVSPFLFVEEIESSVALFAVVALSNESSFESQCEALKEKNSIVDFAHNDEVGAIVLMSGAKNFDFEEHLENILNQKVNGSDDQIQMSELFESESLATLFAPNFRMKENDAIQNLSIKTEPYEHLEIKAKLSGEFLMRNLDSYKNQKKLAPKGFHLSTWIPQNKNITGFDDSVQIPNIEFVSLNYLGTKIEGFTGLPRFELLIKTPADAFKSLLKKNLKKMVQISISDSLDTLFFMEQEIRIDYDDDFVIISSLQEKAELSNANCPFFEVSGDLNKLTEIEGNKMVVAMLLKSMTGVDLEKTHQFLSQFDKIESSIPFTEGQFEGEILIRTKNSEDVMNSILNLVSD